MKLLPLMMIVAGSMVIAVAADYVINGIHYYSQVPMWSDDNLSIATACNAPVDDPYDLTCVISLQNNQAIAFNVAWECTYPPGQITRLSSPPSPLPAAATLTYSIWINNDGAPSSITYQYYLTANGNTIRSPSNFTEFTGFPYNSAGGGGGGNQ